MSPHAHPPLVIPAAVLDAIRRHAREIYPHECCGLLIGHDSADGRVISRAMPAANLSSERPQDRFTLDPRDQLRAEQSATATGEDVLGVYHSHPDHPARPSAVDLAGAWPVYSYLILSVTAHAIPALASFRLIDGAFAEESITTT